MSASGLEPYRRRLDELDETIARALGERFDVCRQIALYKREHAIPMMQPDRVEQVRSRYLARGADLDLPADFTGSLFELLIGATCALEDELMAADGLGGQAGEGLLGMAGDGLGGQAGGEASGAQAGTGGGADGDGSGGRVR